MGYLPQGSSLGAPAVVLHFLQELHMQEGVGESKVEDLVD